MKEELFKLKQSNEKKKHKHEQQMIDKEDKILEMSKEVRKAQ